MSNKIKKILITSNINTLRDGITERAEKAGITGINFVFADTHEDSLKEIKDADAVVIGDWNRELLAEANKLRWVQCDSGGISKPVLFPEFVDSTIQLTSLKPLFGTAGAEAALFGMLLFSRKANRISNKGLGESLDHIYSPDEITGKTVGIIGMGYMGRALAKRAKCLGLQVLAIARNPRKAPDGVDQMFSSSDISRLLGFSDYVVVCVPNTDETKGMVNDNFLHSMKTSSILIDLSGRLQIYNWESIVKAIENEWIAGICMQPSGRDETMPPVDSKFWERENVVVTACRVTSREISSQIPELVFENIRRLNQGKQLEGLVDKKSGY